MINSTNNVHIDGNVIDHEELMRTFKFNSDDRFTQWVLRPVAVIAAVGIGVATFFASAIVIVLSLPAGASLTDNTLNTMLLAI